jgi:hypothetical protein
MRKSFRKGAVTVSAVFAVCAFAVPSMASALSWGPIGTEHTLTATGLAFMAHTSFGQIGAQCNDSNFNVDVRSAAVITITTATFTNCTGTGIGANCAAAVHGAGFHWTATGITTSNIQIHGVDITSTFTGVGCALAGDVARVTGTLTDGTWRGNAAHSITLAGVMGLVAHIPALGNAPFTVTVNDALIIDRQQTITLS